MINLQIEALKGVYNFFTKENISYVFIGGIALQWWGEPRFTRDIDITILVNLGEEEKAIKKIFSFFTPRISNALQFSLKNRICLVKNNEGYEIDISLGIPGYEEQVIKRAVECEIEKDYTIKICSAEDLIIHKAIAGRPQDIDDIETIILRQRKKLDIKYIRKWLRNFSNILETSEIIEKFEKPWKRKN